MKHTEPCPECGAPSNWRQALGDMADSCRRKTNRIRNLRRRLKAAYPAPPVNPTEDTTP